MTEPELTDAQQEAVRRLLASARHDEPMPADVVERLDGVLAGLTGEAGGDVVSLDSTRAERAATPEAPAQHGSEKRSRRWPAYLLSAAAVVAIGFGVTQMIPSGDQSGGDQSGSSADNARPSIAASSAPGTGDRSDSARPPSKGQEELDASQSGPQYAAKSLPLPDVAGLSPRDAESDSRAKRSGAGALRLAERCVPHAVPPESQVRDATFRGRNAVVLYLPPTPSERPVEIYVCGSNSDEPVRSLSLPLEE
ncbi:hypothetical protein ASG90_18430 [Nocardioides sp. Soil797]|nr:hypothetical protein ASG90_18430 [Nocardioides sp. Soil797]